MHDFVIPSSYQLLCKGSNLDKCFIPDKNFLGNQLNTSANHNTGKSLRFEGGKVNFKFLKQYIRKIIIMDNQN
jgi:hypothetical protein